MLLPQPLRPLSVYRNFYLILPLLLLGIRGILTASHSRTLTEILKDYDTLKKKQIRHRIVKRSTSHGGMYEREIHFRSLGREFDLRMIPDHSIFSPDFKAVLMRKNEEVEVAVDKDSFLTGYVEGIVGSKVQAHLEDGILMANIDVMDDSYIVESSSRHVDGDHDFDMIVYRLSDVRSNLSNPNFHNSRKHPSFCGVKDPGKERNGDHLTQYTASGNEETHSRKRRSTFSTIETYDTCNLALVADYLFYDHMGQGKTSTAINYMLSVIQRVDQIYRTITWPSGLRNIGLEVRKVILHSEPSSSSGPGYNQYKPKSWGEEDLLTAFSKGTWMDNDICLGHLFTYQDFADGVIGVAYIANAKTGTVGGICSPVYKNLRGEVAYLASGLSSSMNWGRRLLTSEADVVTAHAGNGEFNLQYIHACHNFGSDHDPFTSECSPGESKGGKFIMYSTSVSGLKLNNKKGVTDDVTRKSSIMRPKDLSLPEDLRNDSPNNAGLVTFRFPEHPNYLGIFEKFSQCSLRSIDKVLVAKRTRCFKSKVGQYCGNNEVEINKNDPSKSEDCDPGFDAKINDTDKCCSTNCKFKLGATCSDTNTPCCQNCRPASKIKKCRESFPLACQGETYCDGVSTKCPEAPKLSGVPCAYSKGKCVNGVCLPFCEQKGLVSCLCSKADDICKICCSKSNSTDSCEPIVVNGTTLNHNQGGPCDTGSYTGSCLKGSCKKTQKNVLDYFSNLLEDFTASKFARFMQENIVGTIMVFSLLVWVPASCIVHYVDKRREREVIERMEWESVQNSDLLHKQKEDRKKGVIKPKKSPRRLVVPS